MSISDHANIAFGPVPTRRLGHSLGINNIPPKHCTYSCVYCPIGRTRATELLPYAFYPPERVICAVTERVRELRRMHRPIAHLSFFPDGDPTLDRHLAEEIDGLLPLDIPIAVFTNGSLLWHPEVRAALDEAAVVSVKVDAAMEPIWWGINRPDPALSFDTVVAGMREFAAEFIGRLLTETVLVAGINDDEANLQQTARLVSELRPDVAYLTVPTRRPAESWCKAPNDTALARAYAIFCDELDNVELLRDVETRKPVTPGRGRLYLQ